MQNTWTSESQLQWCQYLLDSYARFIQRELIDRQGTWLQQAELLYNSPVVVASHGTESDPVLNYGNLAALTLWEMDWRQFTQTPSRLTAESVNREDRARMLNQAKMHGFIADYTGVRISSSGKRFRINQAMIWTIHKSDGTPIGQGAAFSDWLYLP